MRSLARNGSEQSASTVATTGSPSISGRSATRRRAATTTEAALASSTATAAVVP